MKINNSKKKNLIVFDIDGTLTDTVKSYTNNFIKSITQLGITDFDSDFNNYKHHTDSYIFKTIYEKATGKVFDFNKIVEFENYLYQNILIEENCIEIEGAKEMVEKIETETDFGICFATGSVLKTAKYKLEQIEIEYSEEQLVASNHIFEREGIVSKAIENARLFYKVDSFQKIISIGDGIWDLKTAQNLNLDFIGIGSLNKETLLKNGAKTVYDDYQKFDLNALLDF